jgi:hypothetical protein
MFPLYDVNTSYGVECKVGLTGFKWIKEPETEFIGGGEEVLDIW